MSETYTDLNLTNFPQAVDAQSVMQDPSSVEDMEAIAQYQEAMQSGNIQSALSMLASNEKLSAMCLNAVKFNRHEHMIIALERMFLEDINAYISACRDAATPELTDKINNTSSKVDSLNSSFIQYQNHIGYAISGINQSMKGMVRVISKGKIGLKSSSFVQKDDGLYEAVMSISGLTSTSRLCWSLDDQCIGKVMIAGLKCVKDGELTVVCISAPTSIVLISYTIEEVVE